MPKGMMVPDGAHRSGGTSMVEHGDLNRGAQAPQLGASSLVCKRDGGDGENE